jgi:organic hydroperoxide reductase OsmC/OhrA
LLALAVGGCFCNDLHYVASEMGISISSVEVAVTVTFEGDPLLATAIEVTALATSPDQGADINELVRRTQKTSSVSNSVTRGVPVRFN